MPALRTLVIVRCNAGPPVNTDAANSGKNSIPDTAAIMQDGGDKAPGTERTFKEMAKFQVSKNLKIYTEKLQELMNSTKKICGETIYEGAGDAIEAMKADLQKIPVNNGEFGTSETPVVGLSQEQKRDLIDSLGIAKARTDNGFRNVKIGFVGYNSVKTKKYPNGQPNALIARSLNAGTSFRKKSNVIRRAAYHARGKAWKTMEKKLEKEIDKIMK